MSTVTERVERGAALLDGKRCESVTRLTREECGTPAIGFFRRACVHEHVRDGWLCEHHADVMQPVCLACFNLGGGVSHECPITLIEVTP